MKKKSAVTRRDFLRGTAGLAMTLGLGASLPPDTGAEERARVVLIRDSQVLAPDGRVNETILQNMLDEAVRTLAGEQSSGPAWQRFFNKKDVVGIKTNVWTHLSTPKEMEEAIRRRLLAMGIPEAALAVDDRGVRDNPVFLKATALVNVRPVRVHHWSGMGSCLKNYIMFVRFPWMYHGEACSDLGKIWTRPEIKGKTRLNILVALTPQFYGRGPHSVDRRYFWPYQGLIVGTNPVSVDAVGAELLRKKRIAFFGEDRELDVQPIHIAAADKKYRLGPSDLNRIEIIRLGWQEDALV
ncbi:MAG: DUF362 domain-containing protein [Deltaproteobacteria bacterium]|nr:DUF362 domain-containing protein [Deltaproteobacteria bacterium]